MRKGIVREFIWSYTSGLGYVAIEDIETHKLESVPYEKKLDLDRYKGQEVYWKCDQFGMLTRLEFLNHS